MRKSLLHYHSALGGRIMVLLLLAGAVLSFAMLRVESVEATDATGRQFRHLPVQWCAVRGSPTADSPGTADPDQPGASINDVLWRRHERVTDRIYLRLAASNAANQVVPISFRSAVDQQTAVRSFPVITGPNANGDVDVSNTQQVRALVQACRQAWGSNAPGIPVINVNHVSNGSTPLGGWGASGFNCGGDVAQHSTWTVANNYVIIQDRKYAANGDQDANLLGHELGHALNMLHTNPADNIMSRVFIAATDPPHTLSTNIQDSVDQTLAQLSDGCSPPLTGTIPRTLNQIDWHQQEATKWPGTVLDPPDTLIAALLPSTVLLDKLGDVPATEGFVDLSDVRVSEDVPAGVMHVTFGLLSQITNITSDYFFLADLDNNPATGGTPAQFPGDSDLPPPISFTGVEVIVRIRGEVTGPPEFREFTLTPTLWLYQGGSFVKQAPGVVAAFIERSAEEGDHPAPSAFEHLEAVFPLAAPSGNIRVQAITHHIFTGTIDKLDDADAGLVGSLAPPQFPVCGVTPTQVQPGVAVTVEAHGLLPNELGEVILGDDLATFSPIDAAGNLRANFTVPSNARTGLRLVTVGIKGFALTGDCTLTVAGQPVTPTPVPVDIKPQSCPNPLNIGSQGTFTVAILGTSSFDVTKIDPTLVKLEGVSPLRWVFKDVATPFVPFIGKMKATDCTTAGPDGFTDLTLVFDTQAVRAALGTVTSGEVRVLNLTGNLQPTFGGTPIVGEDVVVIKKK